MRLKVYIAGIAVVAVLAANTTTAFAEYDYAEDLIPTTKPEIAESAQLVLDYEPQLPVASSTSSTLAKILAEPEYQGNAVEKLQEESLLAKFLAWMDKQLSRLGGGRPLNTFGKVAIVMLVGLLLLLLIRLLWDIFGGRRFSSDPKPTSGLEHLSPVDLVDQAAKAAAQGNYQQAIRLRFKAVLGVLKMPSSAVLTNSQVLHRLKRNMPFAAAPFGELATIFEYTWYGQQPSTAANYKLVDDCAGKIELELEGLGE